MVFVSKFRATISYISPNTLLALYIPNAGDMHELHVYCGYTILTCSIIHTIAHLCRWALQHNLKFLLFNHYTGISGFIIITSCLLICLPMMVTYLKTNITYEIRKSILHYLFIVFAITLCFHTTPTSIPNGGFTLYVFTTLIIWWLLDTMYCMCYLTERIETTKFEILPSGFQMTMDVSERFQSRGLGGYGYICIPWVNKNQWHAFSLFENPMNPTQRQIFVQSTRKTNHSDTSSSSSSWTGQVLNVLQGRNTVRPAYIQGPYPSPYEQSTKYDNMIEKEIFR